MGSRRERTERTPQLHFGLGATPQQTDGKKTDKKHSQQGRRRVRSDEGAAENWEEEDEEKASPIGKREAENDHQPVRNGVRER